jgi:hypothetical protein
MAGLRDRIVLGFMQHAVLWTHWPLLIPALAADRTPQARVTAASSILEILLATDNLEALR